MDDGTESQTERRRRERLVEQAGQMVDSGRLTREEADRLHAAGGPGEVDGVIRDVRVRHTRTALDAAVGDGTMSRDEADGFLARLRSGEHLRFLRGRLRHRPGVQPGADTPGGESSGPEPESPP